MNEERLHKLWENTGKLNKDFTIDYDTFKNDMGDQEKRHRFYDSVRKLNPKFTLTNEEVDNDLGFANDATEPAVEQELSGWQKFKNVIKEPNLFDSFGGTRKQGDKVIDQREEDIYLTTGMTDQDQQDAAALKRVEREHPFLNKGSVSPVDISEETEATLNRKSEMASYVQRGDAPNTIYMNAFERAMNTEEGKNYYNTLLNEAVNEFVNSDEHKKLLEQYKLGQVSEEEINKTFSEKYEDGINKKFAEKMLAKGTPLGNYLEIAEKRVYMKYGASDAIRLEGKIDAALEKSKQESNDKFREEYKKHYGVYPEDDRMSDLKAKALQQSGSLGYRNQYDKTLLRAQKFNTEAITLINAVAKKNDFGDFWRGVGDAATDLDTWDLGIGELTRNVELLNVIKKLEHNETAPADQQLEITKSEQMLLDAALNFFTVSAYYSDELGRGYKAGQTSMASLPFMLEFILSSGTMAAVDASVKSTARAGAALLVKQLRKRGMQKLANAATGKVSHMVGSMASGIVSSAINAAYMTGVYGTARIAGGTVERMTGQVKPVWDDENKQFIYGGREHKQDLGEALWNSAADTYIENLSEMVLAKTLDPMRAFVRGTDVFKNLAKNDLIAAISSIRNNPTFKSLRQATQFGGYFEEVAEEYLGGILRRAAMTDVNNWQQAGLDLDGQIDIFLGLAPTSILFGATGAASYYGGIAYNSKKLKESMSSDAQRQMFDQLMKESRSGEFKEGAHDFIRDILLDGSISEEKKKDIIMGVVQEYQGVLSKKLQEQANNVATAEFEKEIDKFIGAARLEGTETIIESADELGRSFVIVGGNVGFNEETIDGKVVRTIDANNSSREIQVRYVKNDGTLTEEVSTIRVSNLKMPVSEIGAQEFKGLKLAQYKASFASLDTFEYEDGIYDTKTGLFIRTKEEQEQIDASEQQVEEVVQQPTDVPTVNTKPRIIVNEEHKVTVDGKQVTVKLTSIASSPMIQREDGSIKSGDFVVTVDGKTVRNKEAKKDYIDAVSEKLKTDHAKAVEEYNQRKAEEDAANTVEPQPLISDEDRAAAAAEQERKTKEAEKQAILGSLPKDKQGEVSEKDMKPEEKVLYWQQEDTPETVVKNLTDQLMWEEQQINSIQGKDISPADKVSAIRKHKNSIKAYEQAIAKWLGQETLDTINAARAEASQLNTPPVQEEAPTTSPVAAPVQEEPAAQTQDQTPAEPTVAPEQDVQQDDVPAESDTTPLPPAEPNEEIDTTGEQTAIEPINLSDESIVFVKSNNTKNEVEIARRGEDGKLYFVKNGKPVSDAWSETGQKFKVFYNGRPYYVLTTVDDLSKLNNKVVLAPEEYTGKQSVLRNIPRHSLKKDKKGESSVVATGMENLAKRVENYKSVKDFLDKVIYSHGDVKLTLRDLLSIPVKDASKSKLGTKSYQFQFEQFIDSQSGMRNPSDVRADLLAAVKEIISDWNAYVTVHNIEVPEDVRTDYYNRLQELMGSSSNSLKVTLADKSNGLNSRDITKNPIMQLLIMLDQASEMKLLDEQINLSSVTMYSTNGKVQKNIKDMTTEEIESDIKDILTEREQMRNRGDEISKINSTTYEKNRLAALRRELAARKKEAGEQDDEITDEEAPEVQVEALSVDDTYASVVRFSGRLTNSKSSAFEKETARNAALQRINALSKEDAISLWNMMESEKNKANAAMRKNIEAAIDLLDLSNHGESINEIKESIKLAQQAQLAAQQSSQEKVTEETSSEPAVEPTNTEESTTQEVEQPAAEEKTEEKPLSATELKKEIERLNNRLNQLDMLTSFTEEQDKEYDAILNEIAEKNQQLEALGKGYKDTSKGNRGIKGDSDYFARQDMGNFEYMVGDVVIEHAESTKRIIKILKAAGIRVVTFKNKDLPKYVSKKKLEELSDGQIVYGFASKDTIYLNEDHFNPNSPLHEFTHLWVTAYKQAFPNEWKRFVEIANKSALAANLRKPFKDGKASPYAKLSADEMASEVLSRYTGYFYGELDAEGRTAFENMMQAQTMEEKIAEKSLLNRIRNIWKKIISWFDKSIEKEKKDDVIDVAIRNFASKPMETLARGREAVNELKQLAEQGYKVQSTYHGTSAEFDQFDNDFMSTGEGAQAYGWGIYVSQVKDIGVSYAQQDADRKNNVIDFGNYPTVLVDVAVKDYLKNADIKNGVRESVDDYIAKLRKQEKEFVEQFIQVATQLKGYSFLKRDLEGVETFKELKRKLYKTSVSIGDITWESEYALEYSHEAEEVSNKISWLQMLTESDKRKAQEREFRGRHLYEVNIPADSYLEDGSIDLENSPYIGYDDEYTAGSKMFKLAELFFRERMDEFSKNELQAFMDKHGIDGNANDFITLAYDDAVSMTLDNEAKNERKRLADYYGKLKFLRNGYAQPKNDNPLYNLIRTGGEIYNQIASILGSQKDASEWFLYNGIIGVRVSTHATSGKKRDTKNYVIFNEADAHIVDHIKFMTGKSAENLDNSKKK